MANVMAALGHIRRARRDDGSPSSRSFERYRSEYEAILRETAEEAGDAAFDEVKEWIIDTTTDRQRLPRPDEVREKALAVCTSRNISIASDSALRE